MKKSQASQIKGRIVPQTIEELDALVDDVVENLNMHDQRELAEAMVCQTIINQPRDEDRINVSFLMAIIRKELSRALCKDHLVVLNENMNEINKAIIEKNLIIQFNQDPNDMQVRDELQRLAEKGSEKAKICLGDAYIQPAPQQVVPPSVPYTGDGSLA